MKPLAAVLLLLGVLRHYGWELLPYDTARHAWNISGAVVIIVFLLAVCFQYKSTALVGIWWIFEESQVVLCSTLQIVSPRVVQPGQALCSSLLGFDLSSIGVLLVALILGVSSYRLQKKENKP